MAAPPAPPALPPLTSFWVGTWSRPPDRPSQILLGLGALLLLLALVPGGPRWLLGNLDVTGATEPARRRRFLAVLSFVAAFLSLGYIAYYLRGGPRAAEAATYWLQGRALSHGSLSWTATDPTASFRAKYLTMTPPDRMSGVLPPGYAVFLAAAFLLGAPMLVGPLLAAALVPATWLLGRELAASTARLDDDPRAEWTGRIAASLSLVSATLRYHTAESLPHGAATLASTLALGCALRGRRTGRVGLFAAAGLALGVLLATEPLLALGAAVVVLGLALRAPLSGADRGRALAWGFAAALPGVALLLAANSIAVGHALASPLGTYVRVFDPAPAFGPKAAALAALRRVRANLTDVANFEPIALAPLLLFLPRARRQAGTAIGWALAFLALQVFVMAPTSGPDVTPGAGAAALASLLPVEHALVALALVLALPGAALGPAVAATLGLALAGFAIHASYDHERLAVEGAGHPRFEPDIAREANTTHGLLFFDDDEGFELAHDPGVAPSHGILAVRMRNDDHDRLLYDLLGHPQSHRYLLGHTTSSVTTWAPIGAGDSWRFEAESDFPPASAPALQLGRTELAEASCASEGHVLQVTPAGQAEASALIELPVPHGVGPLEKRFWLVTPRVLETGAAGATGDLKLVADLAGTDPPLAQWSWNDVGRGPICTDLAATTVELGGDQPRAWLVLTAHGGPVALDKTSLRGR